jgi:pyruvate kinase
MIRQLMFTAWMLRASISRTAHGDHAVVIQRLRRVAAELGRNICILQDLQGPKIRTGRLKDHVPVVLRKGQVLTITQMM